MSQSTDLISSIQDQFIDIIEVYANYFVKLSAKNHSPKNITVAVFKANIEKLEKFRIKYISKKGIVPFLFSKLKEIPNAQKREVGLKINSIKEKVNEILSKQKKKFTKTSSDQSSDDLTKPANFIKLGSRHPISIVKNKIIDIFLKIGFDISEGPEIEDDWHNFTALNLPEHHPARDMQDTFYINKNPDWLLRTHTSSVQIRHMENNDPPIRTISPGRVYRNEDISARSHCFFHQVEGLYIDKGVSFVDLKQTLLHQQLMGNLQKLNGKILNLLKILLCGNLQLALVRRFQMNLKL